MKQISQALAMYSNDYNEYFPWDMWAVKLPEETDQDVTDNEADPNNRTHPNYAVDPTDALVWYEMLTPYAEGDVIFFEPALDASGKNHLFWWDFDDQGGSVPWDQSKPEHYGVEKLPPAPSTATWTRSQPGKSHYCLNTQLSRSQQHLVVKPASTVYCWDRDGEAPIVPYADVPNDQAEIDALIASDDLEIWYGVHGGGEKGSGNNYLFVDGHVEFLPPSDLKKGHHYPSVNRHWMLTQEGLKEGE